jgi:hypothetical protein
MQFSEDRCYVVEFPASCYDTGERVLYHLQLPEVAVGHADEQRIAIVQPGTHDTACNCLGDVIW